VLSGEPDFGRGGVTASKYQLTVKMFSDNMRLN
jgi:hypothetical protein